MAILYTEISAEVLGNLEVRSVEATTFNLDANLNRAQDEILNIVSPRFLYNLVKFKIASLTPATNSYALPTDFGRFIKMWLDYTGQITATNIGRPAREVDEHGYMDMSNIHLNPTQENPIVFIGNEGNFLIQPFPGAVADDSYNMMYVRRPAVMAVGPPAVDCELHANLRNLLMFKATALCASVENYSKVMADQYNNYFKEELQLFLPKSIKPKHNKE